MKVLVVGGGAREHALVWKLKQSPRVSEVFVAPGNAGTALIARNLDIAANDIPALAKAAQAKRVKLTVVGPEAPLADGIVDQFKERNLAIFGPDKAAARIESSKSFARAIMEQAKVPCAKGEVFDSLIDALKYVERFQSPIVVKADGLAAGKGVVVARTKSEAKDALRDIMETRIFGSAGDRVVIEECLLGREVSLLAFTDGKTVVPMVPACDHKRVFDGDAGPNTGGMGSYSPPRFFGNALIEAVTRTILKPVIDALGSSDRPYSGVLYAGLMMTEDGPKVLEFNARFGDPETQCILPRLKTDLFEIFLAVIEKRLDSVNVEWMNEPCVGVVLASGGYPGSYQKGLPVYGLEKVGPDAMVFHGGTKLSHDGAVVTDGGRVLTVAALGRTVADARARAYSNVQHISFSGCHYRQDIAFTGVN